VVPTDNFEYFIFKEVLFFHKDFRNRVLLPSERWPAERSQLGCLILTVSENPEDLGPQYIRLPLQVQLLHELFKILVFERNSGILDNQDGCLESLEHVSVLEVYLLL